MQEEEQHLYTKTEESKVDNTNSERSKDRLIRRLQLLWEKNFFEFLASIAPPTEHCELLSFGSLATFFFVLITF